MTEYNRTQIEVKWQEYWDKNETNKVDLKNSKNPYYTHAMFPYPSGDKLHLGHWFNYAPADTFARFKSLQGYDVFSPMGFDSFGLPAENYAIKTGVHPTESIKENVDTMITQLKRIGCMYDWSKSVTTSTPEYYKWTQFVFLKMFENGLAYNKEAMVNWDPIDQTVLANEQVLADGTAERSGAKVIQKPLKQWFWKITNYSQRLLDGLNDLDWPNTTKLMQENWIGRSEGADVKFKVVGTDLDVEVYTTRIDTIFSGTFVILAPEHPFINKLKEKISNYDEVLKYVEDAESKAEIDRTAETNKTGVELKGLEVVNPATNEKMPIWVSDFVLGHYGSGAVFADAHDKRDFEMAKEYNIPLKVSILPKKVNKELEEDIKSFNVCYSEKGILFNSEQFDGLTSEEAMPKIISWLEEKELAKSKVQYRLRDWLVSRQRYWGAPIPIAYDPEGNPHAIPEKYLPWKLPTDVEFKPQGTSPLAQSAELKKRVTDIFGEGWTPEYDTMDTFVCSSFYTLRYLADGLEDKLIDSEIEKKWLPVDLYIGGPEHACMHLIYSRFVQMVLNDIGLVSNAEPYKKLIHQGIITKDGAKMSKSKGNAVSPDPFVEQYGSDIFRMYLMFAGPYTKGGDFNDSGIKGIDRFAAKIHTFFSTKGNITETENKEILALLHSTIKKVGSDLESLSFNTAISALMVLINKIAELKTISKEQANSFAIMLAPFAPHLSEEIWEMLGHSESIFKATWPKYEESYLKQDSVTLAIQVNGKKRALLEVEVETEESVLKENVVEALSKTAFTASLEDKFIIVYQKGTKTPKLINVIVK